MANNKIIVQLASPERKYVKVYHDFLDNSFLSVEEQMIFIVLKSYIDFREDSGEAFPSVDTLCKRAKMSKPRTIKAINNLIKKGIVKKVQRGLTKTNLYTLSDYATMWACDNVEDVASIADNKGIKPLTPEEHIAELERMGYIVQIKEKGLDSEPTKAHYQAPKNNNSYVDKNTINESKSQAERYSMQDLRVLYDYSDLVTRFPDKQTDIDIVFDILYDALNTSKKVIRVGTEDRPAMVVSGRLLKLQADDLIHIIEQFHQQKSKVKNPKNYLLTALYNGHDQAYLDMMNEGHVRGDF